MKTTLLALLFSTGLAFTQDAPKTVWLLKPVSVISEAGVSSFPSLKEYMVVSKNETGYLLEDSSKRQFVAKFEEITSSREVIETLKASGATTKTVAEVGGGKVAEVVAARPAVPTGPDERKALLNKMKNAETRMSLIQQEINQKGGSDRTPEGRKRLQEREAIRAEINSLSRQIGVR